MPISWLVEKVHSYRPDAGMLRFGRMAKCAGEHGPLTKQSIVLGVLLACCILISIKCLGSYQNKWVSVDNVNIVECIGNLKYAQISNCSDYWS